MSRPVRRVTTRNAAFQQWQALLGNRSKRHRSGELLVQGVRPISLAVEHGWTVRALLHDADRRLSDWAAGLVTTYDAVAWALAPELLAELADKDDGAPELVAVVAMPPDDPDRIARGQAFLGVVFDRPSGPGNVGSLIRSADAFGPTGWW